MLLIRFTPPWPRREEEKPYMKPLPKPPPRAPRLQRHYSDESLQGSGMPPHCPRVHSSADEISSLNHSPSISSSDESYSRTTDASPSPSPPPQPQPPSDLQQWLFPSDIQVNPCSSPETSPRTSLQYISPRTYLSSNNNTPIVTKAQDTTPSLPSSRSFSPGKNGNNNGSRGSGRSSKTRDSPRNVHRSNSSSNSSKRTNNSDKIPPSTLLALAAGTDNTFDSHTQTVDSYRGDTCGSFEFQRAKHRNKRGGGGSLDKHQDKIIKDDKKLDSGETSSNSAKLSMKKDGSSQTDLKMPVVSEKSLSTPGSDNPVVDFERQIRKLLDERSLLEGTRYVPEEPRYLPQLISANMVSITELAQRQEKCLGLDTVIPQSSSTNSTIR